MVAIESRALADRGEGLRLVVGGEARRDQHVAQIATLGAHRLEAREVGLDGVELIGFHSEIEQRLRVARAHIRRTGIVSQVEDRPGFLLRPRRTPGEGLVVSLIGPEGAGRERDPPPPQAARL